MKASVYVPFPHQKPSSQQENIIFKSDSLLDLYANILEATSHFDKKNMQPKQISQFIFFAIQMGDKLQYNQSNLSQVQEK